MGKSKGLRGGERREAVLFMNGGEPQVVVPHVMGRVPDLQAALDTGTSRDRPLERGGMGCTIVVVWAAGLVLRLNRSQSQGFLACR
jgi:hypothetical protein